MERRDASVTIYLDASVERGNKLRLEDVKPTDFIPDMVFKATVNLNIEATLMTDTANTYFKVGKTLDQHEVVDYTKNEYGRYTLNTHIIEGCFSLFDRIVIASISSKDIQNSPMNVHSITTFAKHLSEKNL